MNVWHALRNNGLLVTTDNETSSSGNCSHSQTACLRGCRRFCVSRFGYLLPGGVFPRTYFESKSSRWLTLIILSKARSIAGTGRREDTGCRRSHHVGQLIVLAVLVAQPSRLLWDGPYISVRRPNSGLWPGNRVLQHERVNPISHPGLGHLLVSFSFGILSPSPIISFTGGTRRKAAPN